MPIDNAPQNTAPQAPIFGKPELQQQNNNQNQQQQQQNQNQQQPEKNQIKQPEQQPQKLNKYTGSFEYSKIYYFRYSPVHINTIHIYDQMPQVIFLEIKGSVALGINLHWIPGSLRYKFIQVIIEMRNKSINQSLFHLWYRTVKSTPQLHFALSAIRKYYISHCTNIKVVSPWETMHYTQILYKARYLQRSVYNPTKHIVQRKRMTP